jgi:putative Holliday junction resolvase
MRYLGIDPGRKRVGLAISDPGEMLATPLAVVARRSLEQVVGEIAATCRREAVGALVVGLPLNMDGSRGRAAEEAARLAALAAEATGLSVELWDERLSSVTAERTMLESDMSRAKRRRRIDKVAAQIILQSFLDARRGGHSRST